MGKQEYTFRTVEKPLGNRPLGRMGKRWDYINGSSGISCEDVN